MIDRQRLLQDLKPLLKRVEADLRARCAEVPQIDADLKREHEQASAADRTGFTYEEWRADLITQVAVAWVLSCVFVRFLEDNALISPPRISGPLHGAGSDAGLTRARDERETYFKARPRQTDREYLLAAFDGLAKLSGTRDVFGAHNVALAYRNWPSGDVAQTIIEFFQALDADGTGEVIHDFTDANWDTRFLGDLYQDLSEAARKKYALLQTPVFVEEFILERTLEPALKEFGLNVQGGFKVIDPACGSGHFLLGSFARILRRWRSLEPGASDREQVNRTLASVHGVDLNPYAVAIARFRLLLVAMRECGLTALADAPAFAFNLACGDSLLHGKPMQQGLMDFHELAHAYQSEDLPELQRILAPGAYHAVVANPPYITVKDKALNVAYRERYPEVCHMKYSLSVPFLQRLNDLSCWGGFTGQITANSFMKREFGKKLIERYLPGWDLTHVIDTSGAYIPGHGTPTVILFGRNRKPVAPTIRTAMGIAGEPATPDDPAHGLVWTAIVEQLDVPGSQSRYISVNDSPREAFHKHPWSIGGGGAAELKEMLDEGAEAKLSTVIGVVGVLGMTNADDVMLAPDLAFRRRRVLGQVVRPLALGDEVRDWLIQSETFVTFPYEHEKLVSLERNPGLHRWLWPCKTVLGNRATFGQLTYFAEGRPWWEWHQVTLDRLRTPLSIVFGFVATHNHFVLDRGGKVFKQSAPVIKLPADATEDDHLALLGLLNCSTACFWMKQVFFPKGGNHVGQEGARVRQTLWDERYEFASTGLEPFPLPPGRPLDLSRRIDALARAYAGLLPDTHQRLVNDPQDLVNDPQGLANDPQGLGIVPQSLVIDPQGLGNGPRGLVNDPQDLVNDPQGSANDPQGLGIVPQSLVIDPQGLGNGPRGLVNDPQGLVNDPQSLVNASDAGKGGVFSDLPPRRTAAAVVRGRMIALQEELDWQCYGLYALFANPPISDLQSVPAIALGQRAFEIVLARQMAAGEVETTWFTRHGSTPITEIPQEWPADYRAIVQRRIDLIESDKNIALIEKPEYKRRWNTEPWDEQQARALKGWLLDRLEGYFDLDGRMNDAKTITAAAQGGLREPHLTSVGKTADLARADKDFMAVAALYAGRVDFDIGALVAELMTAESVPALPVLRYKPLALDKRAAWERTWALQREEDRITAELETLERQWKQAEEQKKPTAALQAQIANLKAQVPSIPVPPKYASADFQNGNYWRLRGKLDVPKERWVSFPHCEGADGSLPIAWAGYDPLQLARAIAERYELAKENEGRKLVPLLAAIGQLIPWLKQWHNDLDPAYGTRMGDYFESYLAEEAKALGQSVAEVMGWVPAGKVKKAKAGGKSAKRNEKQEN